MTRTIFDCKAPKGVDPDEHWKSLTYFLCRIRLDLWRRLGDWKLVQGLTVEAGVLVFHAFRRQPSWRNDGVDIDPIGGEDWQLGGHWREHPVYVNNRMESRRAFVIHEGKRVAALELVNV